MPCTTAHTHTHVHTHDNTHTVAHKDQTNLAPRANTPSATRSAAASCIQNSLGAAPDMGSVGSHADHLRVSWRWQSARAVTGLRHHVAGLSRSRRRNDDLVRAARHMPADTPTRIALRFDSATSEEKSLLLDRPVPRSDCTVQRTVSRLWMLSKGRAQCTPSSALQRGGTLNGYMNASTLEFTREMAVDCSCALCIHASCHTSGRREWKKQCPCARADGHSRQPRLLPSTTTAPSTTCLRL